MRDSAADISVPVTCARTLFDSLNPPLVEGASVVIHAKPDYYANRGSLSLVAREIRMVGLGELLARLERRRQLLAAEGLFAAELKQPLPFLPRCVGLITAPGPPPSATSWRTPVAAGPASPSRRRTPRCRARAPPPR